MRTKKVITNYESVRMDELHTLAGKVVECMRESIVFTNLPMELTELEALSQDFQSKWQICKNGGSKLENALKDDARDALLLALNRLAVYVNQVSNGNVATLVSSGLQLEADPQAWMTPRMPILVMLIDGPQRGQLILKFGKVPQTALYEYQYASELLDGEPQWGEILFTSRSSNNVIAPVQAGVVYYARVRARNSKGIGDWSATVSLMAR